MSALPQIVIDTNVVVAGLRSRGGYSFQLLSLIGRGRFEINLSVPLVLEYEEVLYQQEPNLGLDRKNLADVIDYFCRSANHHRIHFLWRPRLSDPDDEMILELAVAAGCEYIVTYNLRDLQAAEAFGIRVVQPGPFLEAIGVA